MKKSKKIVKELLEQCTTDQQNIFKRMYSKGNLELPIETIVDNMTDKNDMKRAISQCERTVEINKKDIKLQRKLKLKKISENENSGN